jgi:septal ring-binding cell division protein DamX
MKTSVKRYAMALGLGIIVAALLAVAVASGWARSTTKVESSQVASKTAGGHYTLPPLW